MTNKTNTDKFFEKIPPLITWMFILFPIWGGFFAPELTAYAVIVFNVYFLYKSVSFAILFFVSYYKLSQFKSIDWYKRLLELDNINSNSNTLRQRLLAIDTLPYSESHANKVEKLPSLLKRILFRREKTKAKKFIESEIRRLEKISKRGVNTDWKDIHHVVIVPHWKEPFTVLRDTLENLKKSNYPTKKINVVLGAEKRDPDGFKKSMKLRKDYGMHFENIWVSNHELTENEIVGKSSNMACAGKHAKAEIDKLGWDLKNVIITSCDADSLIPENYFAEVSYKFVTIEDHLYKYFNAAILFYANIWRLPFYARVKNSISSIYNIYKLIRPDKFVPFSTYSVSFWLIDQIGYWTPWVTPEDYHLFFKGLFHFPKKVSAVPVMQTIMSDAAEGENHIDTIKNTYFQSRRWAWGVSDDGWLIQQTLRLVQKGKVNLRVIYKVTHVLFDHITGVSMTIIIVLGGNIPLLINPQFSGTVLGVNLPNVSSSMVQITVWFMVSLILFDFFFLKPKRPIKTYKKWLRYIPLVEWVVLPYAGFALVILPGIEAHTRLLFGKYLEYYLTKKK